MVSQAHKGSRLIVKDAIYAVPFNSAHFNFTQDAIGIQYGDLVSPTGSPVYTMRPLEGKFGGAIAVEEATTNIVIAGDTTTNYGTGAVVTSIVSGGQFDGWNKTTINTVNTSNSLLCYISGISIASGNTNPYSFSIDFFCPKNNILPRLDGTWGVGNPTNIGGYRWEMNNYFRPSGSVGGVINWYPQSQGGVVAGDVFYWRKKQVEQKMFSTSFVNGTRAEGVVDYNVVIGTQGTLSVWVYINNAIKNISDYKHIFSIRTANDKDDGLTMFHDSGSARFRLKSVDDTGTGSNIYVDDSLVPNGWRLMTARWNSSELSFFVDGVKVGSVANPYLPTAYKAPISFGHEGAIRQANTIFSDLKIDYYALSDEEIMSMYIANTPLYNPYDYRAYAY